MRTLDSVVLLLLPCASAVRRARTSSQDGCINFMLAGDGGNDNSYRKSVSNSMAKKADSLNADAILAIGDNIYADSKSDGGAVSISHMASAWQDVWLKHSGNRRPWYGIMGNADWREESDSNAMRDFTFHSSNEGYWNMPDYWHKKTFERTWGSVEVFFVDSQVWRGSVSSMKKRIDEQIDWLDDAMGSSNATWKVVIGHHPIYTSGSHGGSGTMQDELEPLIRKHQASVYVCGHDHTQQHLYWENVNYIVSGAASDESRRRDHDYPKGALKYYTGEAGFGGITICDATKGTMTLWSSGGSVKYETEMTNWGSALGDDDEYYDSGNSRRRRRKKSGKKTLEDSTQDDSPVEEEEARKKARRVNASGDCDGVQLTQVDLRCSCCTVLPDTPGTKVSCEEYCSGQGLSCKGAWEKTEDDCELGEEIGCDDLMAPELTPMCQCGA